MTALCWGKGALPSRPSERPRRARGGVGRQTCRVQGLPGTPSSSRVLQQREARAQGSPRFRSARPPVPLPPSPAPPGAATAPLTSSRHSASTPGPRPPAPPDSPAHRPLSPAPAASLRSAGAPGGAAAGSGVGGQAVERARASRPPDAGGGRPLSSRGHVNALHLGSASGWGVLSQGPGTRAPLVSSPLGGSDRPAALPVPARAASGAGWGPGQGEGSRGPLARHWLIFYSVDMFSYC